MKFPLPPVLGCRPEGQGHTPRALTVASEPNTGLVPARTPQASRSFVKRASGCSVHSSAVSFALVAARGLVSRELTAFRRNKPVHESRRKPALGTVLTELPSCV